ncbi:MAG: hypothetical protein AAFZ63_09735 [Bacteroidota bacterium]
MKVPALKNIIIDLLQVLLGVLFAIDQAAFVVEFDVNNVQGGVLRKYLSRKSA